MHPHSSAAVLAVGLLTFGAYLGAGLVLLEAVVPRCPHPYRQVAGALLGIGAQSALVQLLGMLGWASRPVLIGSWLLFLGLAVPSAASAIRSLRAARVQVSLSAPLVLGGAALLVNLLVALAPSTKIDELHYHMLVPRRIVEDGALRFYRFPVESALPQTAYQISQAPLHALGVPDAANVVSWALSALLWWSAFARLRAARGDGLQPGTWAAALVVGLYPAIWYVTAGAHAIGDLAIAAAFLFLLDGPASRARLSPAGWGAVLSLFCGMAAAAKLSLAPAALGTLALGAVWLVPQQSRNRAGTVLALLLPAALCTGPLVIWTWVQSGSPLGPVLAGRLGPSVYPPGQAEAVLGAMRQLNQGGPGAFLQLALLNYSPLVWLGSAGCLATALCRGRRRALPSPAPARHAARVVAGASALLVLQGALVACCLPHDPRFLGGLQQALMLLLPAAKRSRLGTLPLRRALRRAGLSLVALPLLLQAYWALPFAAVSLGLTPEWRFHRDYIALWEDYTRLDRLLPRDAVLLVPHYRINGFYAPRPVYYETLADLPRTRHAVFWLQVRRPVNPVVIPAPFRLGACVYRNDHARITCFRTPGRGPEVGLLEVYRLCSP